MSQINRSEIEHISIIPGQSVIFKTSCACGYNNHTLTVCVDRDVVKFDNGNTSVSVDIEMFFQTQWNDKSSWDSIRIHSDDPWYSKILNNLKMRLSPIYRFWNRIKTAFQILTKGYLECDESFLFRSGEQAEAVYKAIGDAIESFKEEDRKMDEVCSNSENITKSRLMGS